MSYLRKYLSQTPLADQSTAAMAYLASVDHIGRHSPVIAQSITNELQAQRSHLKLIASENYSSLSVQLAMGNLLTDKYAEGYVGHRFYAGCENVDICEGEAVKYVKNIFGCDHAYVQPHSGADANLVAFWAILTTRVQSKKLENAGKKKLEELNDEEYEEVRQALVNCKLMGLSLDSGGHLTHGYRHNISSKMMKAVTYSVDPSTEMLDYAQVKRRVQEERPTILLAGYSAYSRRINFAIMREIADSVGAVLMVDMAHFSGLVAGKVFKNEENPVPYAHVISSTTHKTLRGPRGGFVMGTKEFAEALDKGCPLVLGGPLPHVLAAKAIAFQEADSPSFREYAEQVVKNARSLAEAFRKEGVRILSGGTDNHLMVLDVFSSFGLTGRQAEKALLEAGICLNRNTVLHDRNGPWYTSGIRIGTPALTTLGMKEEEMQEVASVIIDLLRQVKPEGGGTSQGRAKYLLSAEVAQKNKRRVGELLEKFPLYPEIRLDSSF